MTVIPAKISIKILRLAIILSMIQLTQSSCMFAQTDPKNYLNNALDIIESRALRRKSVDWSIVRSKSFSLSTSAKNPADTYPAIRYALAQLQDNHSFLMNSNGSVERNPYGSNRPVVMPQPAVRQRGNHLLTSMHGTIGFIVVPEHSSKKENALEFAKKLRRFVANAKAKHIVGWIIDLRDNTGGDMWPMLVGVGPINSNGIQGFFNYGNLSVPWYYEHGEAGVITKSNGKHVNFKVSDNVPDFGDSLPLAVLINGRTASSGEAIAISFHGRPHTRFFGKHTAGLSTSNETIKLSDGAVLYLTTSVEADRNNKEFLNGIDPDEPIEQADIPLGADNDPMVKRAVRWLTSI
ncbi:MAG TPA: S41 family peptidase [Pirellulaceae bacterium]|nr:S41 family peptidase [Pirellulaceae bacterium]